MLKAAPLRQNVYIHRLVAQAFVPNPHGLPEINHLNEDKHDNRACNLEWCHRQSNLHQFLTGKKRSRLPRCSIRKLTPEHVNAIRSAKPHSDKLLAAASFAAAYGVTAEFILQIWRGRVWRFLPA